jgi:hypothetical protein
MKKKKKKKNMSLLVHSMLMNQMSTPVPFYFLGGVVARCAIKEKPRRVQRKRRSHLSVLERLKRNNELVATQ